MMRGERIMKKRIILLAVLSIIFIGTLIMVNQYRHKDRAGVPQQVLDIVENQRTIHSLLKEKSTISVNGFRVNYIKDIDLEKEYHTVRDLMEEEEHWLYIIEVNGNSSEAMLIGKEQGKYDVLMYGGGAEMFYHTLALSNNSRFSRIDFLSYGGKYYFINKKDQVFQVPSTESTYMLNSELYDTPLSGEVCMGLILNNYKDSLKQGISSSKLGSNGLVEQFYDENN